MFGEHWGCLVNIGTLGVFGDVGWCIGDVWVILGICGEHWVGLESIGGVWGILGMCGEYWVGLGSIGGVWGTLGMFGEY